MSKLQFAQFSPGSLRAGRYLLIGLIAIALMAIALGACLSNNDTSPGDATEPQTPVDAITIQSVNVLLLESFPVQARALISGLLQDDCTQLTDVASQLEGSTFTLTTSVSRVDNGNCGDTPVPFQKVAPLAVEGLPAGVYQVKIGDLSTSFELPVDNVAPETAVAADNVSEAPPVATDLYPPAAFAAQLALAEKMDLSSTDVEIIAVTPNDWPDRCLGLAVADEQCASTLTHGYEVVLAVQGRTYVYRTDTSGEIIRAEPAPEEQPTPSPESAGEVQPTPTVTPENCTNLAAFRRDITVPDKSRIKANSSFVKSWRLLNAGTCTWTTDYEVVFAGGDQMGGPDVIPLPKEVPPGTTVAISVPLTAPGKKGTYQGNWKLRSLSGETFGIGKKGTEAFWVIIVVPKTAKAHKNAKASISGLVWHDLCAAGSEGELAPTEPPPGCVKAPDGGYIANGILEEGEPHIIGMEVSLGKGACPSSGLATTFANADGNYIFENLSPGTYCVSIDPNSLHNRPIFIPGAWTQPPDGAYTVTVKGGDAITGKNFGWDYQFAP